MRLAGSGGRRMVRWVGRREECWLCGLGSMIYEIRIRERRFERILVRATLSACDNGLTLFIEGG